MFGCDSLSPAEQEALAVFAEGVGVAAVFVVLYVLRPNLFTGAAAGVTMLWVSFGFLLFGKRRLNAKKS